MTGVRISAKIISVACTVSVQLTARKPPTRVYRMVAAAPHHSACAYDRPNTLSNRRAPATIPLAQYTAKNTSTTSADTIRSNLPSAAKRVVK